MGANFLYQFQSVCVHDFPEIVQSDLRACLSFSLFRSRDLQQRGRPASTVTAGAPWIYGFLRPFANAGLLLRILLTLDCFCVLLNTVLSSGVRFLSMLDVDLVPLSVDFF